MTRRAAALSLALCCALAAPAAADQASPRVVGGGPAPEGQYRHVAQVSLAGSFQCTGTLVAPTWVLTAGHCGSLTSEVIASPIAFPPALISVTVDTTRSDGSGGKHPTVTDVIVHEAHLGLTNAYDVALLKLAEAPAGVPTLQVAGGAEGGLWAAGTLATIAGFGTTSENGSTPDTMQVAQVPIVDDPTCATSYGSEFDATTMVCAGYPQGGVDTCQGDSGGPLIVPAPDGSRRLAGVTSFGEGCARPGKPGVYARIAGTALRDWLRAHAPEAVAAPTPATNPPSAGPPPTSASTTPAPATTTPAATSPAPATAASTPKPTKKKATKAKKKKAKKRAKKKAKKKSTTRRVTRRGRRR